MRTDPHEFLDGRRGARYLSTHGRWPCTGPRTAISLISDDRFGERRPAGQGPYRSHVDQARRKRWSGKVLENSEGVQVWVQRAGLRSDDFLFPSRMHDSPHLGTRQYARILGGWVRELGLDPADYGMHSMRRTKATLIYRRTRNLRAVQLLLGHSKLESTVRYLGIEVDDALEISEQTEI